MTNIFSNLYNTESEYHIFLETWYVIIDSCSLYSKCTNIQYKTSIIWLWLHLNSETTSQYPIDIIDGQRRYPCHSKSGCVRRLYYLCLIEFPLLLILQYRQMYTQYSAFQKFHCPELIFFLAWLFKNHPMNALQTLF